MFTDIELDKCHYIISVLLLNYIIFVTCRSVEGGAEL